MVDSHFPLRHAEHCMYAAVKDVGTLVFYLKYHHIRIKNNVSITKVDLLFVAHGIEGFHRPTFRGG